MDLLSGILKRAKLTQHKLLQRTLSGAWGYNFPCRRSGGFHVIQRGRCYMRMDGELSILEQGDVVFVMRGADHQLLSSPQQKAAPLQRLLDTKPGATRRAAQENSVDLLSVRYEFPDGDAHPFFQELPVLLIVRGRDLAAHDPLLHTLQLLSQESQDANGPALVLERLTDILLYYALRRWIELHPAERPGFRSAMKDEKVGAALDLLHRRSAEPWRLDSLARSVGLSRASLATRFRDTLGATPIEYLTRLRLESGRTLMADRSISLERVAQHVGYSSAFAFSKAYKRVYGRTPRPSARSNSATP
ncbi:MAG: cupin domain-containing protein [Leptospirales bacterium]|nr:cupin domain-containing protein [Leptospirales bacterium]